MKKDLLILPCKRTFKIIGFLSFVSIVMLFVSGLEKVQAQSLRLEGAWRSDQGVIIFSGNFFSYASFDPDNNQFEGTYGGSWSIGDNALQQKMEFNTFDKSLVGEQIKKGINWSNQVLKIGDEDFRRIDDGTPGKLEGAWLFAGRKRNDELSTRDTDQPRKTMKILSGTRFQWIAYNVETAEFFGTGGGTYTTVDNTYTENIDFFSRDSSRVGASLSFQFEIIDDIWHHSGLNSRGEPLYEIWSPR